MLRTLTAASSSVVDVDEAMGQLGLTPEADAEQIDRLEGLVEAAAEYVEGTANQVLQPTELEQRCERWPCGRFALEIGPVRDVSEIAYLDAAGDEQVLEADDWDWEATPEGALVWFKPGVSLPTVEACHPGAVRIRFAAGFNDPAGSEGDPRLNLPKQARLAVLMLAAHWFVNPGAEGESTDAADRLISRFTVYR